MPPIIITTRYHRLPPPAPLIYTECTRLPDMEQPDDCTVRYKPQRHIEAPPRPPEYGIAMGRERLPALAISRDGPRYLATLTACLDYR